MKIGQAVSKLFQLIVPGFNRSKAIRKPLDGNPDWQSPESEAAKLAIIGKERDDKVSTYLWFEIGDISSLEPTEAAAIVTEFFVDHRAGFGDVELHKSTMPGHPILLRLRGKLRLRPSLTLRGRYCPLYQIGYSTLFGSEIDGTFNFYALWDLPPPRADGLSGRTRPSGDDKEPVPALRRGTRSSVMTDGLFVFNKNIPFSKHLFLHIRKRIYLWLVV